MDFLGKATTLGVSAFNLIAISSKLTSFTELSLLHLAPRAATVSAVARTDPSQPKLKVAALDAHAFTRLLGPLREIMERNAGEAYGPVAGPRYR